MISQSIILSKRTRVISTILCITSVASVMLLVLGRMSRDSATTVTSASGMGIVEAGTISNSVPYTSRTPLPATAGAAAILPHRILAYGDSLTAGTSGYQLFPYAVYLERELQKLRPTPNAVVVRHRGLPGWTTHAMLHDLDGSRTGLRSAIQAVQNPPLSLVILLAGTNDLGQLLQQEQQQQQHQLYTLTRTTTTTSTTATSNAATTSEPTTSAVQILTDNLLALHQVCYENGVAHTIAIGIPPSGYQSQNKMAADLAAAVNANLQRYSSTISTTTSTSVTTEPVSTIPNMTYVPFPFPFERGGENWFADTLHFSEKGYQVLGESLVPVVERILQALDEQQNNALLL